MLECATRMEQRSNDSLCGAGISDGVGERGEQGTSDLGRLIAEGRKVGGG